MDAAWRPASEAHSSALTDCGDLESAAVASPALVFASCRENFDENPSSRGGPNRCDAEDCERIR
jgi:hypothetical protein